MGLRSFLVPFRALQALGCLTFLACALWKSARLHAAAMVVILGALTASKLLAHLGLGQFDLP